MILWLTINVAIVATVSFCLALYGARILSVLTGENSSDGQLPDTGRNGTFFTSAWCRGSEDSRRCHFRNLCYVKSSDEFLFVHGPSSIVTGSVTPHLSSVSELNTHRFAYTDVPHSAISSLGDRIRFYEGRTLIHKRFKPDNLMHVVHDDLLPIFSTLDELCAACTDRELCFATIRLAFLDGLPRFDFFDFYAILSDSIVTSVDLEDDAIYCFREAIVGVGRHTLWYRYGFDSPQGPIESQGPDTRGRILRTFVDHYRKVLRLDTNCADQKYALVVSRKHNRRILNVDELVGAIARETRFKVHVLQDRSETDAQIGEIIRRVSCAEMLVGMHGAWLILSLFLKPGKVLLELFPYAVPSEHYVPYKTLAAIPEIDLVYRAWENRNEHDSIGHPEWPPEFGGIAHLSVQEQQRILGSRAVRRHLCCSHPEWLFRIYQDTVVDIPSFVQLLRNACEVQPSIPISSSYELLPGPVRQLRCEKSADQFVLQWIEPWNLRFLPSGSSAKYEIWSQQNDHDEPKSVVTRRLHYNLTSPSSIVDCWVRCRLGDAAIGAMKWVKCV